MATAPSDIINQLNAVLRQKLTGINQYFLHARILKYQGYVAQADYVYRTSIDAMKFSDMLVELILSLGGKPNMQEMGSLMVGDSPKEMLSGDLAHAEATLMHIRSALAACHAAGLPKAAELLGRMCDNQQEHADALRRLMAEAKFSPSTKDCA